MPHLQQDLHYAVRSFRKSPVFTIIAVLSLALGIGANTAIFSLIDQILLRLLPVQNPQQLVVLSGKGRHYGGNDGRNSLSYPMYRDLRDGNQVFSGLLCRNRQRVIVGVEQQSEAGIAELVSGNYYAVLGVRPAIGRMLADADDQRTTGSSSVVLSYAYWKSRFAGDLAILGQTIRVNTNPYTIVGVSAPGFDGMEPGIPAQIFLPMATAPNVRTGTNMLDRRSRWVNVYGRLKPGVNVALARAGLQPLFHQIIEMEVQQPPFRNASPYDKEQFLRMSMEVAPGSQGNTTLRRQFEAPLEVLMGVVGLVLLIACANLASLMTARATSRQKEIAIRLAMGASRGRMIQQLLTESLLLSAAGAIAAMALAGVMVKGLLAFLPASLTGYTISSTPDYRVLAFTFGLALLTGVAFGLAPALQSTKPNIAPTLKDQAGNVMGGTAQASFRKMLVAAQVTLSLLLLIGAGLFVRSLANLRSLNPGFHTENLIQFTVSPRSVGYDGVRIRAFYQRLEDRLRGLPGVRAAGLARVQVLANDEWDEGITLEGHQPKPGEELDPHMNFVSPGYFETLGIPLVAGRGFTFKDDANAPRVALVNAAFAKRYFGDGIAVGHHVGMGIDPGTPMNIEIVGVVGDTRYESLRDEIPLEMFLCTAQRADQVITAYVRTIHDAETEFHTIRAVVHELDPNLPATNMKTLDSQINDSLISERMIATLSTIFGALATVLAIIGLYGVMAYMVARRAREIGIRMALGAKAGTVVWMVMREVLILVTAGMAIGLPTALALTRLVKSQLYGIAPNDPASLALASLALFLVAMVAGYVPARRAAAYDPVRVLRSE
ncbi:MAG TPA: ABC transporter permease [Bryobacteraceae bacterium]|nr:ABC transporter permease [Bryobacteraceae bacterium]